MACMLSEYSCFYNYKSHNIMQYAATPQRSTIRVWRKRRAGDPSPPQPRRPKPEKAELYAKIRAKSARKYLLVYIIHIMRSKEKDNLSELFAVRCWGGAKLSRRVGQNCPAEWGGRGSRLKRAPPQPHSYNPALCIFIHKTCINIHPPHRLREKLPSFEKRRKTAIERAKRR